MKRKTWYVIGGIALFIVLYFIYANYRAKRKDPTKKPPVDAGGDQKPGSEGDLGASTSPARKPPRKPRNIVGPPVGVGGLTGTGGGAMSEEGSKGGAGGGSVPGGNGQGFTPLYDKR